MRKTNIIAINGQHYDAVTGELLAGGSSSPAVPRTTKRVIPVATPKKAAAVRRTPHHQTAHPPAASRTLMRQAVKKPGPGAKRQLKAQGHTDALVTRSLPKVALKPSVRSLDADRLQHAQHIPKSRLISRFSPLLATPVAVSPAPKSAPPKTQPVVQRPPVKAVKHPRTTAELLERALQRADSYQELPPKPRRFRLKRHSSAAH